MKNLTKILIIASLISLANASNENECSGGKASACFSVAKEYDENKDDDKAIEFYKKACELNYAIGCNKVGEKYINLKNNDYAKMFFSKACTLNHHESCVSYGQIFEDEGNCDMASEIYKDTFKNKKFKPAQEKFENLVGNAKCIKAQQEQAQQEAKTKAEQEAQAKAKAEQEAKAKQKAKEDELNKEREELVELVSKCEASDTKACIEVATRYETGRKVEKADQKQAIGYYSKACLLDDGESCYKTAKSYKEKNDEKNYLQLLVMSCDNGYTQGCDEGAKYSYENFHVDKTYEFYYRLCEAEKKGNQQSDYCKKRDKLFEALYNFYKKANKAKL